MNNLNKKSLIITLKIDESSQTFFNEKRKQLYPAYANFVDAHITLFHKLSSTENIVYETLQNLSSAKTFNMQVTGIKNIENFVAYEIASTTLQAIHATMQTSFTNMINEKDKEILWPHITVHNKATEYKAFKIHKKLLTDFVPFTITAIGFTTWYYAKKAWVKKEDYLFKELH
jgi:2'-5' RNA ligase superfamily